MASDLDAKVKSLIERKKSIEERQIQLKTELAIREKELEELKMKLSEDYEIESFDQLKKKLVELKTEIEDIIGFDAD